MEKQTIHLQIDSEVNGKLMNLKNASTLIIRATMHTTLRKTGTVNIMIDVFTLPSIRSN